MWIIDNLFEWNQKLLCENNLVTQNQKLGKNFRHNLKIVDFLAKTFLLFGHSLAIKQLSGYI